MKDQMAMTLRKLRLSGAAQTLDVRLQEARGNSLSHEEFFELVLQDELNIRKDRMIRRRVSEDARGLQLGLQSVHQEETDL